MNFRHPPHPVSVSVLIGILVSAMSCLVSAVGITHNVDEGYTVGVTPSLMWMSLNHQTTYSDQDGDDVSIRFTGDVLAVSGDVQFLIRPYIRIQVNGTRGQGDGDVKSYQRAEISLGGLSTSSMMFRFGIENWDGDGTVHTTTNVTITDPLYLKTWWFDFHSPLYSSEESDFLFLGEGRLRVRRSKNVVYANSDTAFDLQNTRDEAAVFDISLSGFGEALYPFSRGVDDTRIRSGFFLGVGLGTALTDGGIPFMAYSDMPFFDIPIFAVELKVEPGFRWGSGDYLRYTPRVAFSVQVSFFFHGIWYAGTRDDNGIMKSFARYDITSGPMLSARVTF